MSALIIIKTLGLLGIFFTIFAESGLFFGFFLPGDSLLFLAGILSAGGSFDIRVVIILCIIGAILGDSVGYWTGKKWGKRLFTKDDGFFFQKKRLKEADEFYQKHGKYTIVIARFIPIIRTFAPVVAGMADMEYRTFLSYNIIGGVLWVTTLLFLGYFLGGLIPDIDKYIIPIVFFIIVISCVPIFLKFISHKIKSSV